jgi:hypothetical protein
MTPEQKAAYDKAAEAFAKMGPTSAGYGEAELELARLLQAPWVEGNKHGSK